MTHTSGPTDGAILPRSLGEFLIELSLALNRAAMYPKGHPSLERAAGVLVDRLGRLLADRPTLSLGVAKRQLVVEGVATQDGNPVLRSLVARLHRLHIGAIVFHRGASPAELMEVVQLLAAEGERDAAPLGIRDRERLRSWEHIRLYPLAYDQLELVDEEEGEERESSAAAQLWVGLTKAALAGDAQEAEGSTSTEPGAVADAINGHPAAVAYDQVIVGYMLQIAGELRQTGDAAAGAALRRRVTQLVSELSDDVLRRLVAMGGDLEQRQQFLLDAADGFGGSAVVELVRAAAAASQQTISHSMLRILAKFGTLADEGGAVRVEAERALSEQVRALVADWKLADPNPAAYTAALESMAANRPVSPAAAPDMAAEPMRLIEMLLELGTTSPHAAAAVDGVLDRGDAGRLLDVLEAADADDPAANALWRLIVDPDRLGRWIRSGHADLAALDRLMSRAPAAAIAAPLLDALAAEAQRETRLALLRRAGALGAAVVEEASARLADERWYVRRNMLQLLREAGVAPAGGALPHARDEHPVVRSEAMRLALMLAEERERALALGLREGEDEILALAIAAAREMLPNSLVPVLAARTADEAVPTDMRVALIEVLGATRSPLAAEPLLRLAVRGRTLLLRRPRLAAPSPVMLAALHALAALPPARRVTAVVERARRSRVREVRAAVAA